MNSRMEIFRGMTRLQGGTVTMNDFIIDNCIVDSIKDYWVLNISATNTVNNITMTNSTFYKVDGVIASAQTSNSVLISDCTFNEAPLSNNKSYFEYGAKVISNGITITNCIFGIGRINGSSTTVKDIAVGAGTVVTLGNSYKTKDHISVAANSFPLITPYNRDAVELWQDPFNGNFKIADLSFPGRNTTGDPRWR
jgi:hypothetical protein